MKTITLDFETYLKELDAATELGKEKAQADFKNTLLNNLHTNQLTIETCMHKHRIPPDRLMDVKAPAQRWLTQNFTDEELKILLNNR